MAKKKINFDLFQIFAANEAEEDIGFEDILLDVLDNYVSVLHNGNPVIVIDTNKEVGKFIFGTMANNQMNDLPSAYDNKTKKVAELPIVPTAGLAHYTSFLFDKELQIMLYEVKQIGVSFGLFCEFYEKNYNLPTISANLVIDPIDYKRLNKFNIIKKFSVKIARLQHGNLFSNKKPELQKLINIADSTNSGTIEYILTAKNPKDESLTLSFIKNAVRELLKYKKTEEVQVMEVTGKETEEEAADKINFITNRYRLTIEVERKRYNASFALKEKYEAMKNEYMKVRPELLKAYKPK